MGLTAVLIIAAAMSQEELRPYPMLVTAETRQSRADLAKLKKPGTVLFVDGFETKESLGGISEGREAALEGT